MASSLSNPGQWLIDLVNGSDDETTTGVTISSAVTVPAIRYALGKVTGAISQLPLIIYERTANGGAEKAVKHPWYSTCKTRPNRFQGPFDFKEFLLTEAIMYGDGRAVIDQASKELLPIFNQHTTTVWYGGDKFHAVKLDADDPVWQFTSTRSKQQNTVVFWDHEVIHVKGMSTNGLTGTGILDCKRTVRIAMDSENTVGTQLKKGFAGTVMLEVPAGMLRTDAEANKFLEGFQKRHSGTEAAGKVGMLREGIKANVMSMSNVDQQMIEQRKFNRQDIAMLFGLESILGDGDSVSYNSLEQKNQAYLVGCLMRWIKKIEEECDYKLNSEADRSNDRYYSRFNIAALLRPDSKTQSDILNSQVMTMIITRNEARAKLDLNPVTGGDVFVNPAITPNQPGTSDPKQTGTSDPKQKPNNIVENILRSLVRRESRDAITGTKKSNYIGWMENYYASWEPKLADKLEELDIDRDFATTHCSESKRRLLEAIECQPEQLEASVSACVSSWENRIYSLVTGDENTLAMNRLANAMHAIANKPQPAIYITNEVLTPTVNVQSQPTPVNVVVKPADVMITNEVLTPTVNVTAPIVNVTNAVAPAEVTVNLPTRRTRTTLSRDKNGNVTGSEAIEDDVRWE